MKSSASSPHLVPLDERNALILKCLEEAREDAVQNAIRHKVPLVYMVDGKLVHERPWLKPRRQAVARAKKPSPSASKKPLAKAALST